MTVLLRELFKNAADSYKKSKPISDNLSSYFVFLFLKKIRLKLANIKVIYSIINAKKSVFLIK